MIPAMLAAALLAGVLAQEPASQPQTVEAVATKTKVWSDAEAKVAIATFQKARGGKEQKLADRLAAVEALAVGSNKLLVKPLQEVVLRDKGLTVRRLAAAALGEQPPAASKPVITSLLKDSAVRDAPTLCATLVGSLLRAGYVPADWALLQDLFEKDFTAEHVALQQAILRVAVAHKEKQSLKLLLRHLDEPIPEDVDAAHNPPKEYWEKRWKAWRAWRDDVAQALFQVSGQRFHSSKEARAWLRENGNKAGLTDW
jgi:hypothetical protein